MDAVVEIMLSKKEKNELLAENPKAQDVFAQKQGKVVLYLYIFGVREEYYYKSKKIGIFSSEGKSWVLTVEFSRLGKVLPEILYYKIEYSEGKVVYSEYPKVSTQVGFDLLKIGPNGLYDYDDDADVEDKVILKGKTVLKVSRMDIEGAGLFVRP